MNLFFKKQGYYVTINPRKENSMDNKERDMDSIESEERLLDLLGYYVDGPDNSNRWKILDNSGNVVGFIQRKKLVKKNNKKNLGPIFGYCMEIDSKDIKYKGQRRLNSRNLPNFYDERFEYSFKIRNILNDMDTIELSLGNNPKIMIRSKDYGISEFSNDGDILKLAYTSAEDSFIIDETIFVKSEENLEGNKEYTYSNSLTAYTTPDYTEESKQIITQISFYQRGEDEDSKVIKVVEKAWLNGVIIKEEQNLLANTIAEAITAHSVGVQALNNQRNLLNEHYPWNEEIMDALFKHKTIEQEEFQSLIPDIAEKQQDEKRQKEFMKTLA